MKETLNKEKLAQEISEEYGLTKVKARAIMDYTFDRMKKAVKDGDEVFIFGFGKLNSKERAERNGYNPNTKKPMTIKSSIVPNFKPAKPFRNYLNN